MLVLGVYFAGLSLLLFSQSRRIQRNPAARLRPRTTAAVIPALIAVGFALTVAEVLTDGRL